MLMVLADEIEERSKYNGDSGAISARFWSSDSVWHQIRSSRHHIYFADSLDKGIIAPQISGGNATEDPKHRDKFNPGNMPLTRPIIVEEIRGHLTALQGRWQNRRLIDIFTRRVDDMTRNDISPSGLGQVLKAVDQVEQGMPPLKDAEEIDQESLAKHEIGSRVLKAGIDHLHSISSPGDTNSAQNEADVDKAARKDDRDIQEAFEDGLMPPASSIPPMVHLQIFDMDHPDLPPRLIEVEYSCYSELMLDLVIESFQKAGSDDFNPELWLRRHGSHSFGGEGICWEYVKGTDPIKPGEKTIDVINVARRIDYIVAAVHEDGKEIPVPIDVPRCGTARTIRLMEYIGKYWEPRKISFARRISKPEARDVLATVLDTSLFPSRTNDLYIRCSRLCDTESLIVGPPPAR